MDKTIQTISEELNVKYSRSWSGSKINRRRKHNTIYCKIQKRGNRRTKWRDFKRIRRKTNIPKKFKSKKTRSYKKYRRTRKINRWDK